MNGFDMQLADNEIYIIEKYEDRMRTAVFSGYSRGVIISDLEKLRQIYNKVKGIDYNLNKTCASCQLTFLKLLGRWWFENKERVYEEMDSERAVSGSESGKVSEAPEPELIINDLQKPVTNTNKTTPITTNKGTRKQPRKNGKKDNITE